MELTQMYYFKVVAELEHFNQAAAKLNITQPTLSQTIARLEDELGVKLFDRTGRRVYLNQYGREFYEYTRRALQIIEDGKDRMSELKKGNTGIVRIGVTVPEMITVFLRPYLTEHPDVHLHQDNGISTQLQQMLEQREIDFAITIVPINTPDIQWEPVMTEELGILHSKEHPFSSRSSISLRELENENFVVNNSNRDMRELFFELFHNVGIEPNIVFEGEQADLISDLIRKNIGVSLVSRNRFDYQKSIGNVEECFLPVVDKNCIRTVGFARRRQHPLSPAAQQFYDYLKTSLSTGPDYSASSH